MATSLVGSNVGNYRVIAKVGEGGMGTVYLGEHPLIGKRVAIKVLQEELASKEDVVSRFFTEAKAVNDIHHENIVDIVDFGTIKDDAGKDVVYFIMEFLDGEGLNQRLKREGLMLADAVSIVSQCTSALAASHKKNIVHRDLKPENIYLVSRGNDRNYVKLLDFGIAKLTGGDSQLSKHQTRTGLVIGTPAYMSPEQCEGRGKIDWRSDIYSLGVVLYEMLTGRPPFGGEGFGEVIVAHLTKQPPLPSQILNDIPVSIEAIVMHAIEKNRDLRFQSMEEFATALANPEAHLASYGNPRDRAPAPGLMVADPVIPAATGQGLRPTTGELLRPITGQGAVPTRITGQGPRAVTGQGPRPTTLSGSTGEIADSADGPKGGRGVWIGAGGGLLAAAAAAVYFIAARPQPAPPSVQAVVQVAPQAPEEIHVSVESTPPGAMAFRPGTSSSIGTTPFTLTVKKGEPEFDLLLKLDGYQDQTKAISTERDHDLSIALAPLAATPKPAVARPATKKKDTGFQPVGEHRGDKDGTIAPKW